MLALATTGPAIADSGDPESGTAAVATASAESVDPGEPTPAPGGESSAAVPADPEPTSPVATSAPEGTPTPAATPTPAQSGAPGSTAKAAAGVTPFASAAQPAGRVLYAETFDVPSNVTPVMLNAYPASATAKYTAAAYWLNAAYCNGFVMNADMAVTKAQINSTYCGPNGGSANSAQSEDDYGAVRTKAWALGKLTGMTDTVARANGTLSTNTSGGLPSTDLASNDSVMFQTLTTSISLPEAASRFLNISLDSAAQCGDNGNDQTNAPRLSLWLLAGSQARQLTSAPVNVCNTSYAHATGSTLYTTANSNIGTLRRTDNSSYASWVYPVRAASYFGDQSFLVGSETAFGLRIRNTTAASSTGRGAGDTAGTANGNDGAVDNVRIVDVTPWLEKSFSPARVPAGGESTLTLTVRNTTEKSEKKGWSFVDTLPTGLKVLNPASQAVTGTCLVQDGARVSLTADSITVAAGTGWLKAGVDQCTIVVKVTSATTGSYTNDTTTNVSQRVGIDPGNAATVEFYDNSLLWQKVAGTTLLAGSEWTLSGPTGGATNAVRAVKDCTAAPCAADGFDTDPLPGRLKVDGLANGAYVLTETRSPLGYRLDTTPRPVTLSGTVGGTDLGGIQNTKVADATVEVHKLVQDTGGANPHNGEGWTLGVELAAGNPDGVGLTPTGTQTTLANGKPAEVWRVLFTGDNQTANVRVFEQGDDDHSFVSGSCTITATGGATRTAAFGSDAAALLSGSNALRPGESAVCQLTNRQLPGGVAWQKVDDADGTTALAGSQWQIVGPAPAGTVLEVTDCVAADAAACAGPDLDPSAGRLRVAGLAWGSYQLIETRAPVGFRLDDTPHDFTIGAGERAVDLGPIANQRREAPLLPLTGGLGRDAFTLLGLSLLGLGGAALGLQARRQRRFAPQHPRQ